MADGDAKKTEFFVQPDEYRDFALVVEGTKLYVCRHYLACQSPVLGKIFFRDGFQANADDGMQMKDKKLDEFVEFLHCLCPTPHVKKVDGSNLAVMLAYADEYDAADLLRRCVKHIGKQLEKQKVEGEGLVEYLRLATAYRLAGLQKQLVPLVAQLSFDQIKTAHEKLPMSVLTAVYQSKALHAVGAYETTKCTVSCGYCGKACSINGSGQQSSCHDYTVSVTLANAPSANCATCKKRSAADSVPRAVTNCVCRYADFSAELLNKND